MVTVQITGSSPKLTGRVHRNGVGVGTPGDAHGPQTSRILRTRDERLRCGEVLLHGGTTTNLGISLQFSPSGLVFPNGRKSFQ